MQQPLGYRLKSLDRLIEAAFDRVFAGAGVTRRQWQTLNVVGRAPAGDEELGEALAPFWNEDGRGGEATAADVAAALVGRGWLHRDPAGRYALTSAGRSAHAAIAERVRGIRELLAEGVTEQEFDTTMDVLRRMTENLEHAAGQTDPR